MKNYKITCINDGITYTEYTEAESKYNALLKVMSTKENPRLKYICKNANEIIAYFRFADMKVICEELS